MQKEYWTAQTASLGGGARMALEADEIVATALRRFRRRNFSDRGFLQPLRRLIASCNEEANLGALGRYAVRYDALRSLRNLLVLEKVEEHRPSVRMRPIERPLFITGMPRSGTTFLHRMLLEDRTLAAPLTWQLVYPCPRWKGRIGASLCRLRAAAQVHLVRFIAPELNDLHPIAAGAPEECSDLTAQVFVSPRYETLYRVPSYRQWIEQRGQVDAYRFHRRFLQHLDAQRPGRRWILKSPDHIFALDDIRTVYPDARFVFIHRDPVRVMASVARLTEVLRRPFARDIDLAEIGQQVSSSWIDGANRMVAASSDSDSILHLHYRQIMAAPLEAARAVLRHAGLDSSAEAEARMRAWLRRAPRNGGAPRCYDLAAYGLDPRTLRARFAHYTDHFGVELEWDGSDARAGSWV